MVDILESNARVVNVDESLLKKTSFAAKVWGSKRHSKYSMGALVNPSVALIAAIDTDGGVFFSASTVNTDNRVM